MTTREKSVSWLLSEDALICTRATSSTEYYEAEKTIPTQETNSGKKTV
jgi:hypothetical protein